MIKKKLETFNSDEIDWNDDDGFVYIVRELSTGMFYVGKKNVFKKTTPAGRKNKVRSESNWRSYATSSKRVAPRIKANPDDWTFEILWICSDESILNLSEVEEMGVHRCLTDPLCYNENIKINRQNSSKDASSRRRKPNKNILKGDIYV